MEQSPLMQFRESLLDYLHEEKRLAEEEIQQRQRFSREEKIQLGLVVPNCHIIRHQGIGYEFETEINNSKFRPGDIVEIQCKGVLFEIRGRIVENLFESISLETEMELDERWSYDIIASEVVCLANIIHLAENIIDGSPGAFFLNMLAGHAEPSMQGFGIVSFDLVKNHLSSKLNEKQIDACKTAFNRPSAYCLQGPPGTGKTDVLANIAMAFSISGKEVLVVSNTHQAVNNALNKISKLDPSLPIIKIGEELKAIELNDNIILSKTYNEYLHARKKEKKRKGKDGDIVGMTFHGAVLNVGLRNTGFKPCIVLVDEAAQMPFAYGSLIGSFGSGSIMFIGDDRQMPPIFHNELVSHPYSTSIFSAICSRYPNLEGHLDTTYRMNMEIANYVSKHFYEPHNEYIIASDFSRDRILQLNSSAEDKRIQDILNSTKSIHILDVTEYDDFEDQNLDEAKFAADLVAEAINCKMKTKNIAVITPYRRQVKAIRDALIQHDIKRLPLIDTVERLQGQDVEMIIISMCISSPLYFAAHGGFVLDQHRSNVMISRAKMKVVVLASSMMYKYFN